MSRNVWKRMQGVSAANWQGEFAGGGLGVLPVIHDVIFGV